MIIFHNRGFTLTVLGIKLASFLLLASVAIAQKIDYPTQITRGPFYDIRTYGAKCDNAANDHTAIQNTVDTAQAAGGGIVMLPAAPCKSNSAITVTGHVYIVGFGADASALVNGSSTDNAVVFDFTGGLSTSTTGAGIFGVSVIGQYPFSNAADSNAGAGIKVINAIDHVFLQNFVVKNHKIGVYLVGGFYPRLNNFAIRNCNLAGVMVDGASSVYIWQGSISNFGSTGTINAAGAGLYWVSGSGLYVNDLDITTFPTGVVTKPAAGQAASFGFFTSVKADGSRGSGWLFDGTDGSVSSMELTGSWGCYNGCTSGTTLSANMDASQTSFTVVAPIDIYPANTTVGIGTEQLSCTTFSAITNTFSGCTRGFAGTVAATHTSGDNFWACWNPGNGIHVRGSHVSSILVNGGRFNDNGGNAMEFDSGTDIRVNGAYMTSNGQLQNNAFTGVLISANVSTVSVMNSTIGKPSTSILPGNPAWGINVAAGTGDYLKLANNIITGNLLGAVTNSATGTHNEIYSNTGYNPVGLSSITVGSSPYTYTAGPSPEVVYIRSGTVSAVDRGATTVCTASPCQVTLPPNGSVTVTYSVLPTMVKDIQ